jgi:hypothetical protein
MATKEIIIRNTTGSDIALDNLGLYVSAGDILDVSDYSAAEFRDSELLFDEVDIGNIVVNDGSNDLSPIMGRAYLENDITIDPVFVGVGGTVIPLGTTAERPSSPIYGTFRLNVDTEFLEYYDNDEWQVVQTELIDTEQNGTPVSTNVKTFDFTGNISVTDAGNRQTTVNVPLQNTFQTVTGNTGTTTANTATDILNIVGTGGVSTSITGDTLTVSSTGQPNQNAFSNISDGTNTAAADSTTDTLNIIGGTDIDVTVTPSTDTVTIDYTGPQGVDIEKDDSSITVGETVLNFEGNVTVTNEGSKTTVNVASVDVTNLVGSIHQMCFMDKGSVKNKWLGIGDSHLSSNDTNGVIPWNSKLLAITFSNEKEYSDTDVKIYSVPEGGGSSPLSLDYSWSIRNARSARKTNFTTDIIWHAGDRLGIFMKDRGTDPKYVIITLYLQILEDNFEESFDNWYGDF